MLIIQSATLGWTSIDFLVLRSAARYLRFLEAVYLPPMKVTEVTSVISFANFVENARSIILMTILLLALESWALREPAHSAFGGDRYYQ